MRLKANLHMHTADDPIDAVPYTLEEAVDHAAGLGFDVLALTCHHACTWREEYATYAAARGILLMSGVELSVSEAPGARVAHVLLVGAGKDAEHVHTFADLAAYRAAHPETLIIAPHPYFYGNFSLHELLEKHIGLFDAIEHSWFYSKTFNRNGRGLAAAARHNLPVVATSDTHYLDFFDENYSMIDAPEKTPTAIIEAVRRGKVEIHTSPRLLVREMLIPQTRFTLRRRLKRLGR